MTLSRNFKMAVTGAVLAAATLGATAAQADTALPSTGNSNWVLLVHNNNNNQTYVSSFSLSVDSVLTASQIVNNPYTGPGQVIAPNAAIQSGVATDAALSTFLGAAGGDFIWTIMAADTTYAAGQANVLGAQRYLTTSSTVAQDLLGNFSTTNGDLTTSFQGVEGYFQSANVGLPNPAGSSVVLNNSTSPQGDFYALFGQTGSDQWFGGAVDNTTALSDAARVYLITSSGGTGGDLARLYTFGTFTLSATNGLTFTADAAPVPLPAAVWLLFSGLVGMVGVGRRRAV
jgi:hypothetical protein